MSRRSVAFATYPPVVVFAVLAYRTLLIAYLSAPADKNASLAHEMTLAAAAIPSLSRWAS